MWRPQLELWGQSVESSVQLSLEGRLPVALKRAKKPHFLNVWQELPGGCQLRRAVEGQQVEIGMSNWKP
jgi:hypothetical protein